MILAYESHDCPPHVVAFMVRLEKKIAWAIKTRHASQAKRLNLIFLDLGKRNGYFSQTPW